MASPTFDDIIAQVNDALRAAQADAAIAQLTRLLQRPLPAAQRAHAHALLAQAYEFQSRWDEAAQLLRPYEERAHSAALPAIVHQLLCLRLASLRTEQGDMPATIYFARQALQLAKLADDPSAQGEAHQMLGKAYRLLGQPAYARQHYQAALNLHQKLGARVLMAKSYFGLNVVAAGRGEYALARQSLQRAFTLVTAADDPMLYGLLCGMQATTLALEEVTPLDQRVEWLAQAKTAFEAIGHRRFLARTLGNWGDQLLRDGQWQEASALLQQALALGQELQDRRSLANVLESLAELHTLQGHDEISLSYLAEALAWVEGHDHFVELQVRLALARWQWQQGQSAAARAAFEQVIVLARETEARQWQITAQLSLAEMALQERQEATVEEILRGCQPALEQLNNLGLVGHLRFVEGGLALARQELSVAREALEQACTVFGVSGRCWWLGRSNFRLAEVLAQADQLPAAHEAMHRAAQQFQRLAAQPFLQQCEEWFQHHPLPPTVSAASEPTAHAARFPETEGVGRLLRAVPFRDVVLRELFALLHAELPHCHLTLSEHTAIGAPRLLLVSERPLPRGASCLLRLEPWRCPPLTIEVRPAPPLTPKLGNLLQAAQAKARSRAHRKPRQA